MDQDRGSGGKRKNRHIEAEDRLQPRLRLLHRGAPLGVGEYARGVHPKADLMDVAEYVSLEELYRRADIITLHMPLVPATKYIINRESISMMKPGVIIINCARGPLADPDALIEGIESEKIGALGLDVIDGEEGITHVDHRVDIISNQKMAYLRQFRNVVMTQHMAFYTEEAVENMVRSGILGILEMSRSEKGSTEL